MIFLFKEQIRQTLEKFYERIIHLGMTHVYGPKRINYGKDELIVLCLVRNGKAYMKSFIEHYLSLGAKHIVLLDNNSTDGGVSIAKNYKNITVLRTKRSFKKYNILMKRYLINRFSKSRWCLIVDIDEFFDYPYSDRISLKSLLDYLNKNKYNAVVTQMLDMFSDKPLSKPSSLDEHKYYDLSNIQKKDYFDTDQAFVGGNKLFNKEIKMYLWGIRKTIFNTDNLLTKHSLVFSDNKISPMVNLHYANNARIADFSTVLYHYKFLGNLYEKAVRATREKSYWNNSYEYKKYLLKIKENPDLCLKSKTSKKFKGIKTLIDAGFLVVSKKYIDWVKSQK